MLLVLLVLGTTLVAGTAAATPDPTVREWVVVLGWDDSTYYNLRVRRVNEGSYYLDTDSTVLERWTYRGARIERLLVRVTVRSDSTTNGHWFVTDQLQEPVNVHQLLASRRAWNVTPSADLLDYVRAHQGELWLVAPPDSARLGGLASGDLTGSETDEAGDDAVSSEFAAGSYRLLVVRREFGGGTASTEVIVPLEADRMRNILGAWYEARNPTPDRSRRRRR